MKTYQKILAAGLLVLAGMLIVILGIGLYSWQGSGNEMSYSRYSFSLIPLNAGKSELQKTSEWSAAELERFKIDYSDDACDIIFLESDSDQIVVKEYGDSRHFQEAAIQMDKSKQNLTIKGPRTAGTQGNSFIMFGFNSQMKYTEIYLPSSYGKDLEIHTASGDIISEMILCTEGSIQIIGGSSDLRLNRLESGIIQTTTTSGYIRASNFVADEIDVMASSGDIRVNEMKANKLNIQTTSGDMKITDLKADKIDVAASSGDIKIQTIEGDVNLTATSGGIRIQESKGNISANTSSGDINLGKVEIADEVSARATSGGITLSIPRDRSYSFEAETTSGEIRTFFDDVLSYNNTGNRAEGTIGNESAAIISLVASSGDVKVLSY